MHNPITQLERYFGFPAFRALPENAQGDSLQKSIVQAAMRDSSLFSVLPSFWQPNTLYILGNIGLVCCDDA